MKFAHLAVMSAISVAVAAGAASAAAKPSASAQRGLALAESRCARCHGVTANSASPNPEAPGFEDIANRAGVTGRTMRRFLKDAHNFPAAMNFRLSEPQVRDLAAYLSSLHAQGYKPAI